MIWHFFPIGMRFPVADFSDETRRACWQIALSAIYASDARGTGLYEACESYDPGTQGLVYTCIVCYVGIKQSRAAGKTLHALDALTARLCIHQPFVQANYLEGFGPYPVLAEIDDEGVLRINENGAGIVPDGRIEPMHPSTGWSLLIASGPMNDACDAERLTRFLGTAAADHGLRVKRMQVADGGAGTVRALVAGTNGRYETVVCEGPNGERVDLTIGVIPGPIAVIETSEALGYFDENRAIPHDARHASNSVGLLMRKALDLGYRELWIGLGDSMCDDLGLGALSALGIRFLNESDEPVEPCPEAFSAIEKIDREGLDSRILQSRITLLFDTPESLLGTDSGLSGMPENVPTEQIQRIAALLGGDANAFGSGAACGLGLALASIGGTITCGVDHIFDRIGLSYAMREADFVITGTGRYDAKIIRCRKTAETVLERLSEARRPGCLIVGEEGVDTERVLREHPNLKSVVTCPVAEDGYAHRISDAFSHSVLPLIGKDIANPNQL